MSKLKKLTAFALGAVLAASAIGTSAFAANKMTGDVNGDKKVTAADVLLIRKHIAGQSVKIDAEVADVNFDGKITAADVLLIRRAITGAAVLPTMPNQSTDQTTSTTKPTQSPTQKTTSTTAPAGNYQIPSSYPSTVNADDVLVDQVGYSTDNAKFAVIKFESRNQTAECYVVNAANNAAMFKATSAKSKKETTVLGLVGSGGFYAARLDFTNWNTPGTYYIATPYGRSYNFTIAESAYDSAQDKLITALYYSRCGQALDKNIVGAKHAHAACHNNSTPAFLLNVYDKSLGKFTANENVNYKASDFSGGLHDAGDYGRYTRPGNGTVASLLVASELFPKGVATNVITDKSGESIADTLDEARYEMQWMMKMQNPANGGIYFRIATKGAWNGWSTPDKDNSGFYAVSRETVITSNGFAGNAAYCYTLFKDKDKTFADKCLAAAKKAYAFAEKYYGNTASGFDTTFVNSSEDDDYRAQAGAYGDDGVESKGEYFYAAAALYRATGEAKYKTVADRMVDEGVYPCNIDGYNVAGAGSVAYLINSNNDKTRQQKILAKMTEAAESSRKCAEITSYVGCPMGTVSTGWGCNTQVGDAIQNMAIVDYFSKTKTYDNAIRNVIHFLFGTNGTGYSFVSGVGSKTPVRQHNRHNACGEVAPGWVSLGYWQGYWEDNSDSAQRNEIAIYCNTTFITGLASVVQHDKTK